MDNLEQQIQQDVLNGVKPSEIRKTYHIGKQRLERIVSQIPNEQVTTWRYYPVAKDQIISFWQQGYTLFQITCMTGYPLILCEKVLKHHKVF